MHESTIDHLLRAQQELAYSKTDEQLPEEARIHIDIAQRNIIEALKECERTTVSIPC